MDVPPLVVSVIDFEAGGVAPWAWVKLSEVGETPTVALEETVSTTGRVKSPLGRLGLPVAWMVIEPL